MPLFPTTLAGWVSGDERATSAALGTLTALGARLSGLSTSVGESAIIGASSAAAYYATTPVLSNEARFVRTGAIGAAGAGAAYVLHGDVSNAAAIGGLCVATHVLLQTALYAPQGVTGTIGPLIL